MAGRFARALACVALAAAAVGAMAAESPAAKPAEIPFAHQGGIRNWKADGTRGPWVQDNRNRWYYATLLGPCQGLDFAHTIAFDTGADGALDEHSAVRVKNGSMSPLYCPFKTFVASDGPPPPQKKPAAPSPDRDTNPAK